MAREIIEGHVVPFSNGTEGYEWVAWNCDRCALRGTPDANGDGPCPMETAVSMGFMIGTVPADLAAEYGATVRGEYCDMPRECAKLQPVHACEYIPRPKARRQSYCGKPMAGTVVAHRRRYCVCAEHGMGDPTFEAL